MCLRMFTRPSDVTECRVVMTRTQVSRRQLTTTSPLVARCRPTHTTPCLCVGPARKCHFRANTFKAFLVVALKEPFTVHLLALCGDTLLTIAAPGVAFLSQKIASFVAPTKPLQRRALRVPFRFVHLCGAPEC